MSRAQRQERALDALTEVLPPELHEGWAGVRLGGVAGIDAVGRGYTEDAFPGAVAAAAELGLSGVVALFLVNPGRGLIAQGFPWDRFREAPLAPWLEAWQVVVEEPSVVVIEQVLRRVLRRYGDPGGAPAVIAVAGAISAKGRAAVLASLGDRARPLARLPLSAKSLEILGALVHDPRHQALRSKTPLIEAFGGRLVAGPPVEPQEIPTRTRQRSKRSLVEVVKGADWDERRELLASLRALWDETRDAEVARMIDRVGKSYAESLPAWPFQWTAGTRSDWAEAAASRDPVLLSHLLDSRWPEPFRQVGERLRLLQGWPPDPRLAEGLLGVIERWLAREAAEREAIPAETLAQAIALLGAHEDPRTVERARPLGGRSGLRLFVPPVEVRAISEEERQLLRTLRLPSAEALTEAELVATVEAHPDDDGPRLVLAEWLSAQGDPRGEFIALQVAMAHGQANPAQLRRERALWREHGARWTSAFEATTVGATRRVLEFRRGFPAVASLQGFTTDVRSEGLEESSLWRTVAELSVGGSFSRAFPWKRLWDNVPTLEVLELRGPMPERELLNGIPGTLRILAWDQSWRSPIPDLGLLDGLEAAGCMSSDPGNRPNPALLALHPALKQLKTLHLAGGPSALVALIEEVDCDEVGWQRVVLTTPGGRTGWFDRPGWELTVDRGPSGELDHLRARWNPAGHTRGLDQLAHVLQELPEDAFRVITVEPSKVLAREHLERTQLDLALARFALSDDPA